MTAVKNKWHRKRNGLLLLVAACLWAVGNQHGNAEEPVRDGAESEPTHMLWVHVTGHVHGLTLRDPRHRAVTIDSSGVPGAVMYPEGSQCVSREMALIRVTVAEIEQPEGGVYSISGIHDDDDRYDSTLVALEVQGMSDGRGNCMESRSLRVAAGEPFEWVWEYHPMGADSCDVRVIDQ